MDEHKLNLTVRQPCSVPITFCNKCRSLANEELVNLMGPMGREQPEVTPNIRPAGYRVFWI